MPEFIARQDCVITGHAGIVREGDRVSLSARGAKYPRLKGWIEPAPLRGKDGGAQTQTRTPRAPRAPKKR